MSVHLRIGDVIEDNIWGGTSHSVHELLHSDNLTVCPIQHTNRFCYIKNLAYYDRMIGRLPAHIRRAVLIAGAHVPRNYRRSSEYIRGAPKCGVPA